LLAVAAARPVALSRTPGRSRRAAFVATAGAWRAIPSSPPLRCGFATWPACTAAVKVERSPCAASSATGTRGQLTGRDSSGGSRREPPENNGHPTNSDLGLTKRQSHVSQLVGAPAHAWADLAADPRQHTTDDADRSAQKGKRIRRRARARLGRPVIGGGKLPPPSPRTPGPTWKSLLSMRVSYPGEPAHAWADLWKMSGGGKGDNQKSGSGNLPEPVKGDTNTAHPDPAGCRRVAPAPYFPHPRPSWRLVGCLFGLSRPPASEVRSADFRSVSAAK
jgi:hypothetical protein